MTALPHPAVVDHDEWLRQRKELLAREKELTKEYDRVCALRRRLPMEPVDKEYRFTGAEGEASFNDLFQGHRQLIVYHFMFDPEWEAGCPGCTGFANSLGDLSMLEERDATLALVSRAPYEKLAAYKQEKGWTLPWYSSYGSDFNYDLHVTLDPEVVPLQYNFRSEQEIRQRSPDKPNILKGEAHGLSVFLLHEGEVFHTYSAYARGVERLTDAFSLLDCTPFGRQQDFEDSPVGWPQQPTYGAVSK